MRILYVDGVGSFGGASRSLSEALRGMPPGRVEPFFVCARGTVEPVYGELARGLISARGLTRFDNTRYSYYRGIRWLVVLRELARLPGTVAALVRARRRWGAVDVIHANEVTDIVPGLVARRLFGAPLVVHVRSLAREAPGSRRTRWLVRTLRRAADAVVAIDENVRATLPADVRVDVIHNAFGATVGGGAADPALTAALAALRPEALTIGFVGNLHHSKGLFELVEAVRDARAAGRDVECVIVGGTTRPERGAVAWGLARLGLAQSVRTELVARIAREGLAGHVHLVGPTRDIRQVYDRIDVLAFPSHFDAPGRPVFEAAFSGVPSIVAVSTPRPDTVIDGETGLAVPCRDVAALTRAILHFADDRGEVERMGRAAQALARRNFDPRTNAAQLLAVYQRVVDARALPGPS